ncbi:MAG: hypothetical protein ACH344_08660 [Yersinia sp. (in: enterobacteria)]
MGAPPIVTANKLPLLGLIQQAAQELGIRSPSQIFGASDNQTIQLLALANREGRDFFNAGMRKDGWQALRQQNVFNLTGITGYTGTTTVGSYTMTNISPSLTGSGIAAGWGMIDEGFPWDSHVVSFTSNTVTLDTPASSNQVGETVSFGQDSYPLPNDFTSYMTSTSWDRDFRWQLLGPIDAQEWQVLKSGISPTGPRRRFRIMGNLWYVDPVPTAPETCVFEYYSNAWCQSSAGAAQNSWQADTDYYSLDDDAFILGLKWRFLAAKKLDFTQERQTYDLLVSRLMAVDGANRDLPINAQASGIRLLNEQNVPDTGYGS